MTTKGRPLAPGTTRCSRITITTGSDDKRSDSHVFIEVDLTNGNQLIREIGANQTWPNGTTVGLEYIDLPNGIQNPEQPDRDDRGLVEARRRLVQR
jgi:hypothetical protein